MRLTVDDIGRGPTVTETLHRPARQVRGDGTPRRRRRWHGAEVQVHHQPRLEWPLRRAEGARGREGELRLGTLALQNHDWARGGMTRLVFFPFCCFGLGKNVEIEIRCYAMQ